MNILVFNAGSSSLKFSLFEAEREELLASGMVDWGLAPARLTLRRPGQPPLKEAIEVRRHADAVARVIEELRSGPRPAPAGPGELEAVAHRVVHGGDCYTAAVWITPEVKREIAELAELAPLHNRVSLEGIAAAEEVLPGAAQAAAFDTAFHSTIPEVARTYAIPRQWTREWGLKRFGFHGLSHAYCAARAEEMLGPEGAQRVIVAHLGNGASVSAIRGGICVDTSMGFTPLEGLMMGTRSGSVDPGLLIYVMREKGLDADALDRALNHESGLLGVSGVSADMRELLAARSSNPDANLAVELYAHRVRQTIGAMAATLGGVDALVFTAGVGENAPIIREKVCSGLGFLGLELDRAANALRGPDSDVARADSQGRILVIATREDLMIARETRRLIRAGRAAPPNLSKREPLESSAGIR